ncbi:MAG: WecB/TagA/CpsF family glycosyltransferase [Candidatus Gastranaerophilales bacterium]|nr:WecB/TagA/CpsF family glycosyltransferase [Candidatus Gastranaerophilales bacterium]
MERTTKKVLGYEVDLITFKDSISLIIESIKSKRSMHIITINPEIIAMAQNEPAYSEIIKNADLIVPDGSGIKLALKLKGIKQEQIPGIELAKSVIAECCEQNLSIAMVGAKEDVINKACKNLKSEYANLNIVYSHNGYFDDNNKQEIINNLKNSNANFVLAAMGAPKQEFFIKECMQEMKNTVFIGVGGSFDIWAGEVERAPLIFRKFGCEWLYRTINQPQRFRRIYKTLPSFLFKVIIEAYKEKN